MSGLFSITNQHSDNPHNLLTDVTDTLEALQGFFYPGCERDFNERSIAGVRHILTGCIETLASVEHLVSEQINEPARQAHMKAMELVNGEYRRGLREGRDSIRQTLNEKPHLSEAMGIALAVLANDEEKGDPVHAPHA